MWGESQFKNSPAYFLLTEVSFYFYPYFEVYAAHWYFRCVTCALASFAFSVPFFRNAASTSFLFNCFLHKETSFIIKVFISATIAAVQSSEVLEARGTSWEPIQWIPSGTENFSGWNIWSIALFQMHHSATSLFLEYMARKEASRETLLDKHYPFFSSVSTFCWQLYNIMVKIERNATKL